MTRKMSDSVVVITGASSGIGRATAQAFAEKGATVVLAARRERPLEEVAAECRNLGGRALVVPTDVNEKDAVENLACQAVENFGCIDLARDEPLYGSVEILLALLEGPVSSALDEPQLRVGDPPRRLALKLLREEPVPVSADDERAGPYVPEPVCGIVAQGGLGGDDVVRASRGVAHQRASQKAHQDLGQGTTEPRVHGDRRLGVQLPPPFLAGQGDPAPHYLLSLPAEAVGGDPDHEGPHALRVVGREVLGHEAA